MICRNCGAENRESASMYGFGEVISLLVDIKNKEK